MVQLCIVDKDLSTPPGSPADEAAYIVGASPTGAWSGKSTQVAWWSPRPAHGSSSSQEQAG
ncbi:DUF2793 domain-containing protein [Pseudomonas nitroreducens]|uniref:DUF2793 domain-containing protein n=1 Tax=Pseudomonas nitroreducens TaxID=46680 RepID=UPI003B973BE9